MKKTLAFLILVFAFSNQVFAAPQNLPPVETYEQLLHAIRGVRAASQQRIEQIADQEKVREAWETGQLIHIHVLNYKERGDYDKQVILRLSVDLGTSDRELYYMLKFYRAYPISPPAAQLSWSHYRELLSLNDPKELEEVTKEALRRHWTRDQVRKEVRRRGTAEPLITGAEILTATPGKVGTYRVIKAVEGPYEGELVVDLGFSNYYKPDKKMKFQAGDIISIEKGKPKKIKAGSESLFTYRAYVSQITDGDTFWALIDLGFGFTTKQQLRLRGLDAPEIESSDGREAKEFVAKQLRKNGEVLIKTVKSDKYDRYLADVWVGETYLNQKLIDKGLAVSIPE